MKEEDIIIKPLVTEKSTNLKNSNNKYSFVVHKDANKILVEKAVKKIFNVTPLNVNIINVSGKRKRVRYKYGYTSAYKKAIVSIKSGEKIAIFEGA